MLNIGKLRIHSSFVLFLIIVVTTGSFRQFFMLLAAVTAHELAHVLAAAAFGLRTESVVITPIGEVAHITGFERLTAPRKNAVLLAGPLLNIACAFVIYLWLRKTENAETFMYANAALGVFNLLPVYPMDGGRLLHVFLGNRLGILKSAAYIRLLAKTGAALFIAAGFMQLVLFPLNASLLAVGIFFAGIYERERPLMVFSYYNRMLFKGSGGFKAKTAAFPIGCAVSEVERIFTWDYFHIVYVIGEDGGIAGTLTERRIFEESAAREAGSDIKLLDIIGNDVIIGREEKNISEVVF